VFVLDSSASGGAEGWAFVLQYAADVVSLLPVSSTQIRFVIHFLTLVFLLECSPVIRSVNAASFSLNIVAT
jgi:hypothetical protein